MRNGIRSAFTALRIWSLLPLLSLFAPLPLFAQDYLAHGIVQLNYDVSPTYASSGCNGGAYTALFELRVLNGAAGQPNGATNWADIVKYIVNEVNNNGAPFSNASGNLTGTVGFSGGCKGSYTLDPQTDWYIEYSRDKGWIFDFSFLLQGSDINDDIRFGATTITTEAVAGSTLIPYMTSFGQPKPNFNAGTVCLGTDPNILCISSLPVLASISTISVAAGSPGFDLMVKGSNFITGVDVDFTLNGKTTPLSTQVVDSTSITAQVPASLLTTAGTAQITIAAPDGSTTPSQALTITGQSPTPVPGITSFSPASATAGGAAFTLTVNGSNFASGAAVRWNGTALTTQFVSATQLTASVSGSLIASSGTASITVFSGGQTSAASPFTIAAASGAPPLTLLTKVTSDTNGAANGLCVTPPSVVTFPLSAAKVWVYFNVSNAKVGDAVKTSFIRPDGVTHQSFSDSATAAGACFGYSIDVNGASAAGYPGTWTVQATWNGATLFTTNFTLTGSAPVISGLSPASVTAGASNVILLISGSNFTPNSVARWNGAILATVFLSPKVLNALIPPSLVASPGTASITVSAAGQTSVAVPFTIAAPPASSTVTIGSVVVSDKSGSANGACTAPPQVSVFTPATSQVWLYFTVSNATVGDTVTVRFLRPDGVAYQTFTGAVHFASGCFTYGMDFAGTTAASYGGPWTIQVLWNQSAAPLVAVTFIVAGAPLSAEPTIQSVGNAASYAGGSIALGEIVYIVGTGMGPAAVTTLTLDDAGLVATQLAGTSVRFNGIPAPLIYTSASAVAAIVPYEAPGSTAQVTVTYQGRTSPALSIPISNALPGLFTLNSSGTGQLSALNEDFSINGAARPAVAGSIVTLFATGEGQTSPTGVDGKPATVPIPKPVASVTATIGGIPAPVLYAGGAPGEVAGVMQVNVLIPPGVSGPAVPVLVKVGTVSSQAGTTIAVAGKP